MILSIEEIRDIIDGTRNSMKIQNEIGLGDLNLKPTPGIDIYMDDMSYYNPSVPEIHLGALMILEIFDPETPEEFLSALNYIRGHEEQHVRSTVAEPYATGIRRSMEEILEYISSKVESSKRRFRSPSDYEYFANVVLPGMGIYVSYNMVQQIVAGLANSLEDGRIERIRSVRFPGFEKMRTVYRGKFWMKQTMNYPDYKDIQNDLPAKLEIITMQILSLATTGMYARGFAAAYAGTPMMNEVNVFIPYIAKAVMARRTRGMAEQLIEVSKALAPYIYETCKMSATNAAAKKALEKMLADMLKSMVDSMPENTGLAERDEDTEEDPGNSPFPNSDLCVTLDDETYDKLVEKSKNKSSEGGMMIRREHPKEKQDEQPGKGKGSGSGQNQKAEEKSERSDGGRQSGKAGSESAGSEVESFQNESSEAGSSEAGDTNSGGFEMDGSSSGSEGSGSGSDANGSASQKGGEQETNENNGEGENDSGASAGPGGEGQSGAKNIKGKNTDPSAKSGELSSVEAAMKKAAEEVNEKARQEISNINQAAVHVAKTAGKEVPNTDKPITAEDVKGICPHFEEVTREYKLVDNLPAVLMSRGRSMLRKNKNYFKSLSTPNVSFLDTGSVDPGRIYGLAMGDTDIFRRRGKDKKFDGCAYILIDNSGSMSGNKRIEACKAAAVIEEGFRGLIPIKIVAFDYSGSVIHEVIKGWTEQMHKNCCWNFCLHGREGGGNADGYDIMIATKELLARPEQKKLLLVLSDGMPAEASPGFTKGAIEAARKKGIQVSGIYFEEGRVGRDAHQFLSMYGDGTPSRDAICCPLSDLDTEVEKVMKKFSRS